MGEPWKYQSGWKTEDLFTNYYTQTQVNTLVSSYYGFIPSYASAPTNPRDGQMYLNTTNDTTYLYHNGAWTELHVLTTSAPVTITTGSPMGLLLSLTYQL